MSVCKQKLLRLKDRLSASSLLELQATDESTDATTAATHKRFDEEEQPKASSSSSNQKKKSDDEALDALVSAELEAFGDEDDTDSETDEIAEKSSEQDMEQAKLMKEYLARMKRERQLREIEEELSTQRQLMTKGRRKVIGEDDKGNKKYKWLKERKR